MPIPPDPRTYVERKLNQLASRIGLLERSTARSYHYSDGTRDRVVVGRQSDGKYGLRIWDASGILKQDNTW